MKLFYREIGQGQPLLILHGLFGSSDNWLTVSKPLSENYKVYLIDQRNHGRSPWLEGHNYDLMAEDLLGFMAEHSIENPIIIGHSMGGKTAMKFACKYPDKLKALIVVDISPRAYPPHHEDILAGLNALHLPSLENRNDADAALAAHIPQLDVRNFLLKNLYRNSENAFAWRINLDHLNLEIDNIGEALPSDLHFNKPTLFIKGSKSPFYIREKDVALIKYHFPFSDLVTIQNAGHWIQAEQPEAFLEEVNAFINKIF